jgi:hypothetical protein
MRHTFKTLTFAALALAAQVHAADDEALRRCRSLVDPVARLGCYDAVSLAPQAPTATPASFGLQTPRDELDEINSSIRGHFEGWGPRSRIPLANGQVWQISDDSSASYELNDPKVKVRRAALGSFVLEIEGARRAPKVRRIE